MIHDHSLLARAPRTDGSPDNPPHSGAPGRPGLSAAALAYGGDATDRLRRFMPMVRRLAWHLHGSGRGGIEVEDLMQAGLVALTECAQRHNGPGEDGFAAYAKTTGGKGLHIVTPFVAGKGIGWKEAKTIAREICARMAADHPDKYLVNMSKEKRKGRIFLDYLRNDLDMTWKLAERMGVIL